MKRPALTTEERTDRCTDSKGSMTVTLASDTPNVPDRPHCVSCADTRRELHFRLTERGNLIQTGSGPCPDCTRSNK